MSSLKDTDWSATLRRPWLMIAIAIIIVTGVILLCIYLFPKISDNRDRDETAKVVSALKKRSESGIVEKRQGVIRYISSFGPKEAYPILVELLFDTSDDVARAASEALVKLEKPAAILILDSMSKFEDDDAAWELAKQALVKIGKPIVPELVKALDTNDEDILVKIEECLVLIGDDDEETIEKASKSGKPISVPAEEVLHSIKTKEAKKAKNNNDPVCCSPAK